MKRIFISLAAVVALTVSATASPADKIDEAYNFLMQYMPEADRQGHSAEFFRTNVEASFAAVDSLGWQIPEREFRHFVLPLRVNNEWLDSCRTQFFAELYPRIKGMSMADAILEVNHWLHEKVTYRPSDPRTSSPLQSVKNAIGRCGEESTFGVAALRAVGIPARQVYTTRWAHTDDNHAWVEAWADGKWHFLGACEPEPVLDLAWFNEPASRGILMVTRVFGPYDGPEEVLEVTPLTTTINVTSNYAPASTVTATVTAADGRPVAGADVDFTIYNYAQFFPLASKRTDSAGQATFLCGHGDILVWATDGTHYGYAKANPANTANVTVVLDKGAETAEVFELNLTPPAMHSNLPAVSQAQRDLNEYRKAQEDSIRAAYCSTFATPAQAEELAAELGVDARRLTKIICASRGNHADIAAMLRAIRPDDRNRALSLLESLQDKDLYDIRPEVVNDALANTPLCAGDMDEAIYNAYILCPRVGWEPLSVWRKPFLDKFGSQFAAAPDKWAQWISDNIELIDGNPVEIRPVDMLRSRKADKRSREILFVTGARAFGIPARKDLVTGKVQWFDNGVQRWNDVTFSEIEATDRNVARKPATITLVADSSTVAPKYFMQFTLSQMQDGRPVVLDYEDIHGIDRVNEDFKSLDPGQYMLTTGQRLADGSVLSRSEIFTVSAGETVEKPVIVRHDSSALEVIGNFNSENLYRPLGADTDKSLLATTGRGFYVVGFILPGHEPSAHALNDIAAARAELEASGRQMVVLLEGEDAARRFDASLFPEMPSNLTLGIDPDGALLAELRDNLKLSEGMPVFAVADTFNRVVYVTTGYTIGLGNRLASILDRLK